MDTNTLLHVEQLIGSLVLIYGGYLARIVIKLISTHVHDKNVGKNLDFAYRVATDSLHTINAEQKVTLNELRPALTKAVADKVDEFNANKFTRHIHLGNDDVTNAVNKAIDNFKKDFGLNGATRTYSSPEAIEDALKNDTQETVQNVGKTFTEDEVKQLLAQATQGKTQASASVQPATSATTQNGSGQGA